MGVIVSEEEKRCIYLLNRRKAALEDLLETINNTTIKMESANYRNEIQEYARDVQKKISDWWDDIYAKYNLDYRKKSKISFVDGKVIQ